MIQIEAPTQPAEACLDAYLAQGWFRAGNFMSLSALTFLDGNVHATLPVRAQLHRFGFRKSLRRSLRRNRERFRVEIGRARSDPSREALYRLTQPRFSGAMFRTLSGMLEAEPFGRLFPTEEIAVYDGQRLVAVSFFDCGVESTAGLLGLYDPQYARHGLGTFTLLLEVEHAIARGHRYYYPGFVALGHPGFAYKLRLDALQYRSASGRWRPIEELPNNTRVCRSIEQRTRELAVQLERRGVRCARRANPFFWVHSVEGFDLDLLDGPVVLECRDPQVSEAPAPSDELLIAEYAPHSAELVVCWATGAHEIDEMLEYELSREALQPVYLPAPLTRTSTLWRGTDPARAAAAAARALAEVR